MGPSQKLILFSPGKLAVLLTCFLVCSVWASTSSRPGVCPLHDGTGSCLISCKHDNECKDAMKCCSTRCGGQDCKDPLAALSPAPLPTNRTRPTSSTILSTSIATPKSGCTPGAVIKTGPCTYCTCDDDGSTLNCEPPISCASADCSSGYIGKTLPGDCCPSCVKGDGGCPHPKGTTVPDGSKFELDDCTWCKCTNGEASCSVTPGCIPITAKPCSYSAVFSCDLSATATMKMKNPLPSNKGSLSTSDCQSLGQYRQCVRGQLKNVAFGGCSSDIINRLSTNVRNASRLFSYSCSKTQCYVGGVAYGDGQSYPSSDGCNTCSCSGFGSACTLIACGGNRGCRYGDKSYNSGDSFPALDGCNKCSCKSGVISCSKTQCDKTRYVRTKVVFNHDFQTVIPNVAALQKFKQNFILYVAKRLQLSEAQITVISVKSGSIVVIFAVESPNVEDVQDLLTEVIESQDLVVTFNDQEMIASNLDYSTAQQVGAIPGEDDSGGANVGLIVGVVCGCLALIIIVALVVVIVILMKKSKNRQSVSYANGSYDRVEGAKVKLET